MQSIEYRYKNDTQVHALVDMLTSYIYNLQFTPSEIRECAMLAAINYERNRPPQVHFGAVDELRTTNQGQK